MEPDTQPRPPDRRGRALLLLLALALVALVASCPLGYLAVSRGIVRPPGFRVGLGSVELTAPCPPQFGCDSSVPYYALWHGQYRADGSVHYRLLYFTYLPPLRRR